jgi:glutamyl-tRNA synthetase
MGAVVTRFPPEPSGYLHLGHAKAAMLNQYFADAYGGKLLVRFDDTNPSKEKDEFVENILKDMTDLGLKWHALSHTSDHFPALLDMGVRLIKSGDLYADDTPVEAMREQRMVGAESACRARSVEENLRIFAEMQAGSEEGARNAMRFKMDMRAPNKALRDPVAFRCNATPHWRTGTKYKARARRRRCCRPAGQPPARAASRSCAPAVQGRKEGAGEMGALAFVFSLPLT